MGTAKPRTWFRERHEELLTERDGYYGGNAPWGEIPGWVARRLEELILGDDVMSPSVDTDRTLIDIWCDLIALYRRCDERFTDSEATYEDRIIELINAFEYPIPTRIVAGVLGCSKGHARRFYWDDEGQCVREKEWSRAQRDHQATPAQVAQILERDGHTCVRCGVSADLIVHHIQPVSQEGKPLMENLVTLCSACHKSVHGGRMSEGTVQSDSRAEFYSWIASANSS